MIHRHTGKVAFIVVLFNFIGLTAIAQYGPKTINTIDLGDNKSLGLVSKYDAISLLTIDNKTRQSTSVNLSLNSPDSLPPIKYVNKSPSLVLSKEGISGLGSSEIIEFNDILDANPEKLVGNQYIPYWLGYYNFKDLPGIQVGNSIFMGTAKNIKKGNYVVFGSNTLDNGEIILYQAEYNKGQLQILYLSDKRIIHDFFKNDIHSFYITNRNWDNSRTTFCEFKNGITRSNKILLEKCNLFLFNKPTYIMLTNTSHGAINSEQGFYMTEIPELGLVTQELNSDRQLVFTYGGKSLFNNIDFKNTKTQKDAPMVLNIAKYGDPDGETLVLEDKDKAIELEERAEKTVYQTITLNIAKYGDPDGINLLFERIAEKYVNLVQVTRSLGIDRYICRSNEFGEFNNFNSHFDETLSEINICKAIKDNDLKMVSEILTNSPDSIEAINYDGNTPLHYSAHAGTAEMCNLLIDKEAKTYRQNNVGETPLHIAAARGNIDVMSTLIERGAEHENAFIQGYNRRNKVLATPLLIAIDNAQFELALYLLQLDNISLEGNTEGLTPLDLVYGNLTRFFSLADFESNLALAEEILNKQKEYNEAFTLTATDTLQNTETVSIKPSILRFYETGSTFTDYNERVYSNTFMKAKTRYIAWELTLEVSTNTSRKDFELDVVFENSKGEEINRHKQYSYVENGWTSFWNSNSYGNERPGGFWDIGLNKVKVYYQNKLIAQASFMVY